MSDSAEGKDWIEIGRWVAEVQTISSDRSAYPLAADSLLAGDEKGMPPGVSVAAVVRSLLDSAIDDLSAALDSISPGKIHPVGIATLTRGAVELAGLGMWVLTGSKRQGRQQRALRVAHDSAFNAARFFRGLADSSGTPMPVREESVQAAELRTEACDQIVAAAARLGIKKTTVTARLDRTGHLQEVDKARDTDFLQKWQLCSGYAHGLAWAAEFFNRHLYTHEMEGGGRLQGAQLPADRALAMLGWGRHAIEELQGTFTAGRTAMPGWGDDATLFSGRPEKAGKLFPGRSFEHIDMPD
ncbi:hypothetical protein [Sinomonas flava]|uniref:hypothetical protein n=1 Tax=Sinomonas flava TaxID=496857 RepID=UPI0039A66913